MCDREPINLCVHCVGVDDLTSRTSGRRYNSEVLSHSSVSYQQQHAWLVSADVWLCHLCQLCAAVVRMNNRHFGLWYAHKVCAVQHLRCPSAHNLRSSHESYASRRHCTRISLPSGWPLCGHADRMVPQHKNSSSCLTVGCHARHVGDAFQGLLQSDASSSTMGDVALERDR